MSTAWLQARNNSHDVLAADVLAGDATIEVTTAATQFPAAYPYRVTIWDAATHADPGDDADMEIMQVTGRAGNVLNVMRAQEGTAAAAHTAGDVVRLLVTAGMVQQVQDTIDAHDHSAGGDGGTVSHVELANIGSNTHAQIDTHIGSTANPHSVTAAQAGAPTTGDLTAHTGAANPHGGSASTGDLTAHTGAANPHSGSASTGDLTTHTGDTANPHSVTAAQVGKDTAQWNADEVQSVAVDDTAIADGYVLKYDAVAGTLVYAVDDDTTDHGALSGLGDDDHAQYHTDGRALTWLGTRSTTDLPEGTGLYHTTARARAAISATTPLAYDSNTGVLSIQQASALQAGYLSAADWTTFNDKQAALTLPLTHENGGLEADVSAYDGLVKITGGATSAVTDNSADWNTAAGLAHAAVTVADTTSVGLTLTGQQVSAAVLPAGVDHDELLNTHNLTTDIDHNALQNTHNLTTDIDHNALQNTHNLTTDIDHNALTNYDADRHYLQTDIEAVDTDLATGLLKVATGTGALSSITDGSANWDAAYSHVSANGASHTYIDQDVTTTASPTFGGLDLGNGKLVFGSSDDMYLRYTSHASMATLNLYPFGSSIVNSRYVARCDEVVGGIASFTAATNEQITPVSTNRPGLINFVITAADPDALKGKVDVYVNTGDLNEVALTLNDDKSADFAAIVNAAAGFEDNGVAGIDTTFEDADGNTITVSGGIITAKTAP